jgi:predicted phage terminase large subunit-like protein
VESHETDIKLTRDEILAAALEDEYQVIRESRPLSLFEFIQVFWSEVSDDEFKPNWHIEYLCSELEKVIERIANNIPRGEGDDLIINIPPGTTKTITCSIMLPAWAWTKYFWMKFITASYSATLSLESAEKSRDLIRSDKFKAMYPDLGIKDDKDTKSNFRAVKRKRVYPGQPYRLTYGGNRYSTSVGGTLTGFHGHVLIVDDPLNPEQAASEKELENCNRWMEQTLPTRKTDKAVSGTILVMQRLHQADPTGRLLEKKKKTIKHICLPGQIRDYKEFLNPPELAKYYKDGLLDATRLNWGVLEEMELDLGQYGYAGQIGQNPTPPGGGMFKVERMPIVHHLTSRTNIVRAIRYWDKAATADGGAYTAGVKMLLMADNKVVIEDVVRKQMSSEDREAAIKSHAQADALLDEDYSVHIEQEGGSGGKESAEATIRSLAGFPVYADRPTGNKEFRADPLSVAVNNGNVILLQGDWNKAFKDELEMFPNGTYKDQVDAAAAAYNILTGRKQVRIIR